MVKQALKVIACVLLVAAGTGLIFGGFEMAAYEKTVADREVTTSGDVIDTEVWQLTDGNWTYQFEYEYRFDQEAEITDQGLEDVYAGNGERAMASEQYYRNTEDGDKHDTQSDAQEAMEENFNPDGSVTVYVDPFHPGDGSLSDATSLVPRLLQYGGSLVLGIGLLGLARMARRVSS